MSEDRFLLEHTENGVTTLTLNRPDRRNALNVEMTLSLRGALERAALDSAIRVVVITGAGEAFCSGGDVKAMAQRKIGDQTYEQRVQLLRFRTESSRLLHEMPKPTVALIGGAAAGAGLALALACDFRVAISGAKLTTAFGKVGLSGDFGMSYFLPRLVGMAKARELLMLSPVLTSEEAMAMGLVHRVHKTEEYAQAAKAFVDALAEGPTVALGYMKRNLNASLDLNIGASLDVETHHQVACFGTQDHVEAAASFVEKRAPRFLGR